jgi:hypothetical protein
LIAQPLQFHYSVFPSLFSKLVGGGNQLGDDTRDHHDVFVSLSESGLTVGSGCVRAAWCVTRLPSEREHDLIGPFE